MKTVNKKYRNRKLKLLAWFLRTFRGREITHAFYYSQRQKELGERLIPRHRVIPTFQGKLYTEMRDINEGWCNWPDSYLVGLGSTGDLVYPGIAS